MADLSPGRWPPSYDADQLQESIRVIVRGDRLASSFYMPAGRPIEDMAQGDIFELDARFAYLDECAQPRAESAANRYWVVIGNTCDLARNLQHVRWTQLAPIRFVGKLSDTPENVLSAFKRYEHGRRFFVPPWSLAVKDECMVAEFLEIVTIHRSGLAKGTVVARMDFPGWILFHSCLVRYLARDDGRHDQT
ncbi:MAG: hypothetical protein EA397_16100 [Deltaproteobacteria bacterium]|nr:MAG: hypothetical protein EA397_16100 [Deltaproteobacteria bacterium]